MAFEPLNRLKDFFSKAFRYKAISSTVDVNLREVKPVKGIGRVVFQNLQRNYRRAGEMHEAWNYARLIKEYEMMDRYDIISAALDTYASEATFKNLTNGRTIWVVSEDKEVQDILMNLLDRIELEDHVYEIARNLAKYGNDFNLIIFAKDLKQIDYLDYIYPANIRVVRYGGNLYYLGLLNPNDVDTLSQEEAESIVASLVSKGKRSEKDKYVIFDSWAVVHFALSNKQRSALYGTSILESVLTTWRRLAYLENAMWFKKLRESVSRYLYYVQIGEYDVESVEDKLTKFINILKMGSTFSPQLSQFTYRYDTWLEDEDLFIPVRSDRDATRIETLDARQYDVMEEINFFVSKLAGGLRIPKSYLLFDQEVEKTTLGMQDMRFAKSVMRLQDAIIKGVVKLCDIELLLHGYDPLEVKYEVKITRPSLIFELATWDAEKQKLDVAESMLRIFPKQWILKHFFNLSDAEIEEIMRMEGEGGGEEFGDYWESYGLGSRSERFTEIPTAGGEESEGKTGEKEESKPGEEIKGKETGKEPEQEKPEEKEGEKTISGKEKPGEKKEASEEE